MPLFERSKPRVPSIPSRRAVRRRMALRKLAAAAFVGLAVWLVISMLGFGLADRDGEEVLVAGRDLPAGHTITPGDVATRRIPHGTAPEAVRAVTKASIDEGRVLTGHVGVGEMLSSTRLRSPDSFDRLGDDRRAVHVPLRDHQTTALINPGSHVDVHSTADGRLVVADAIVLQVDQEAASAGGLGAVAGGSGPGVVISVPADAAAKVMSALGGAADDGGSIHLALRSS